ncbi:MAG: hypothetical protein ACREB7_03625 [Sphingopyxis sp.]|uniref:hypothetical protein n=1 Tax=Sphingopyxis sp. TaxID=1908224 RepID=UPI003D6D3A0C
MSKPHILPTVILAMGLFGCGPAEEEPTPSIEAKAYFDVSADAKACDRITASLVAGGDFKATDIAGCDGIIDSANPPGFRVTRVNGYCHEEMCGSVLLGWFAVKEDSGQVFEVADVGDWKLGSEVTPSR